MDHDDKVFGEMILLFTRLLLKETDAEGAGDTLNLMEQAAFQIAEDICEQVANIASFHGTGGISEGVYARILQYMVMEEVNNLVSIVDEDGEVLDFYSRK